MGPHGKELPEELKNLIVRLYKDGKRYRKIGDQVKISLNTAAAVIRRYRMSYSTTYHLFCDSTKDIKKKKKPLLALRHKTARLNFTKEHEKKPDEYWEHILWSDETKINLFGSEGSSMFGVNLARTTTVPTVKHGGGSVMIWGCMSAKGLQQTRREGDTPRIGQKSIARHPKQDWNPRPTREEDLAKLTVPLHS
uniref:Transposase Tc1-like domain-containing protein n=1 Tax=Scleropages formosus TaxID=113540 RepID=A0A8C9V7D3_SCLFO